MPASLAPISPELFADFKGGKETALEQVFRANFEAFTQEANEKLQDVAAAQKVAASAFLDVWDRRGKLESSAQLESTLHQAVNGEATHELRRRAAAHHMAGDHAKAAPAAAPETVDQWWIKVQGAMKQPQPAATDAAKRAEHMRHEAAAHMKAVAQPKRTGLFMAIGAVVFIGAAVPLYYMNQGAETTKAGQLLGREDAKVMVTKPGQRGTVTLEDSTVIRLGSATTVKYPKSYPLDAHALQIIGTAGIKAPKTDSPLLVKVGNAWLYVSEAEFVARSFPEDSGAMMLKATAGTLTVKFGKTEKTLAAGSTLLMLNNGTFMDLDKDRGEFIFAWADGNFAATHQPLRKVLAEIKKFYGIEIMPKDSSFLDRPVSMTASLDSAKTAITALEAGGAVKVKLITETKAELVDNAANVKPKN
ncbi:MAG: hypothetical protein P3B98_03270 [Gemmatimonadota bacterium]|nr:hypothetical protein [Gemmatimonadota bacterium]